MKILIIEDEKSIRDILKECFQDENYLVDIAEDGKIGLFLASTNNYSVILLDYCLPGLNGKEVCLELRKQGINTPIIMLTAITQFDDKIEMLNLGADDYITKPFMFAELLARVSAVLRRPKIIEKEIIKINDLSVEVHSHEVTRANKEICLTTKEFQIFLYLVKNVDRVVSFEELMENVWDMNVDMFSKTVKVHVMNLRKKVDGEYKNKLIKTINRNGYMISSNSN